MQYRYRTPLFFILSFITSLPFLAWGASDTRALGEIGLEVSTDRREDASGSATSERRFLVDISTGAETAVGEADRWGYGAAFKSERGLHGNLVVSGFGLGGFLSWRRGSFSARLDGVFLAEQKAASATTETIYRDGSGWGVEARWLPTWFEDNESKTWALGPSLSFRQITFKKNQVGSLPESNAERTIEIISPGLRAIFLF